MRTVDLRNGPNIPHLLLRLPYPYRTLACRDSAAPHDLRSRPYSIYLSVRAAVKESAPHDDLLLNEVEIRDPGLDPPALRPE